MASGFYIPTIKTAKQTKTFILVFFNLVPILKNSFALLIYHKMLISGTLLSWECRQVSCMHSFIGG